MWELGHKEGWALKNWRFWILLEKAPECPLDSKEIEPVNPKGNQPWICIGRTDAEAEAPILWPPEAKSWLTGKTHSSVFPLMLGRLRVGGEEGDREWNGWMASPNQWTWVWANCRREWRTGKPGMLQCMGLQRVGHDLTTKQQATKKSVLSWIRIH